MHNDFMAVIRHGDLGMWKVCAGRKAWATGGVLDDGQPRYLYRGNLEDTERYYRYIQACRRWLENGQKGEPPTFKEGPDTILVAPDAFDERVEFAARKLREHDDGHRAVDTCFEMWDGKKVVHALMAMAQSDPFLMAGIKAQGEATFARWSANYESNAAFPLLAACGS